MTQQAPGVWRITVPLPFRPREVHAYLVQLDDGKLMLVDGGVDTQAAWTALDAGLRAAAGDWSRVVLNVITHMHMDHVGLAARVRTASHAEIAMGRLDAERFTHAAMHPEEEGRFRATLFSENGVPADLVGRFAGTPGPSAEPLPIERPLDGQAGKLAGAPGWEWTWTPGHTAGHIALFRRADGVLIAGDTVLPRITPTIGVNRQRPDPVGDYREALERLEGLAPSTVLPGHGEPIAEPAERMRELGLATEAESAAVRDLLRERPGSAWELATLRYRERDLPASARVQALRETLAHLHHLVARGLAEVESGVDGVRQFRAT